MIMMLLERRGKDLPGLSDLRNGLGLNPFRPILRLRNLRAESGVKTWQAVEACPGRRYCAAN